MNWILSLLFFGLTVFNFENNSKAKSPNIVLILFDDLGYGDLSCYGALDIHTPVMDKIASEGIRFTNYLAAQAVCSASRASLLTGCYPNRIGITGALFPDAKTGIHATETTIAQLLKQRGYHTAIFGKWHLGDRKEYLPLQHGFDEYYGLPYSNDMWPMDYDGTPATHGFRLELPTLPIISGNDKVDSIKTLDQQSTLTQRYTDKAIDFIHRNRRDPFFLYLPFSMPHVPIAASSSFKGTSIQGLYGDVVQELDASIGRVMDELKKSHIDKNTLIIITSDNGPWINFGNHAGNSGGYREGKGTTFEGGHRVPLIIRWNGTLPQSQVCNQLCTSIDILPTLASITHATLPSLKIDGIDLSSLLFHPQSTSPRSLFYYYYRKNALEAIRRDNWKLVFAHPGRSYKNQLPGKDGIPGLAPEDIAIEPGLYDLRRDPGEQYDVSAMYPDIVSALNKLADDARNDLGDDLKGVKGTQTRIH